MSLARDKQNKQRTDPRRSDVFILVSFDRMFLEKRKVKRQVKSDMQNNRSAKVYGMTSQKEQQQNSLSVFGGRDHADEKKNKQRVVQNCVSLLRCISQYSVDKSLKQFLSLSLAKSRNFSD